MDTIQGANRTGRHMKTAYGRIVFGAAAVLLGVIALMWHDADTWQTLVILWKLPLGRIVGDLLMIAQIAGGLAILSMGTARLGAIVLAVVYALFSLACIPGIVTAPAIYQEYGSFFEQLPLLCGAIAVYAITEQNAAKRATLGRVAIVGLGLSATSFMLEQAFYLRATASLVPTWIPPNQMFWAILTTVAFGLAALAMFVNFQARLAIQLMTLMLAIFGVLVWIPRLIAQPQSHANWSEFALTFLITGAAAAVAQVPVL